MWCVGVSPSWGPAHTAGDFRLVPTTPPLTITSHIDTSSTWPVQRRMTKSYKISIIFSTSSTNFLTWKTPSIPCIVLFKAPPSVTKAVIHEVYTVLLRPWIGAKKYQFYLCVDSVFYYDVQLTRSFSVPHYDHSLHWLVWWYLARWWWWVWHSLPPVYPIGWLWSGQHEWAWSAERTARTWSVQSATWELNGDSGRVTKVRVWI